MTKLKSIAVKNSEYTFFKKGNAYIITFMTSKDNKVHLEKLHFFDELVAEGIWADITLRVEANTVLKRKGA